VETTSILLTPTLVAAAAYTAGDYVGPTGTSGIPASPASNVANGGGTLQSLLLVDTNNQGVPMDIYFFTDAAWASPADNAPWSINDASAAACCGMVSVNAYRPYSATGLFGFATFPYGAIPYKCAGTTIYLALVTRGGPTYTPTGLRVRLGLYKDDPGG